MKTRNEKDSANHKEVLNCIFTVVKIPEKLFLIGSYLVLMKESFWLVVAQCLLFPWKHRVHWKSNAGLLSPPTSFVRIHPKLFEIYCYILFFSPITNITAWHKKAQKQIPLNYRPVNLLPIISKVMKSILSVDMKSFLFSNNLMSDHQFCFRPGHSTLDMLLWLSL